MREETEVKGERPDFIPIRRKLHSFVFELKGSEEYHLENHLKQLSDYMDSYAVQLGVLTNMRELKVYNQGSTIPISNFAFSFALLYKSFKENKDKPLDVLDLPNTKNFLEFCERFKFRIATREDKIKAIREAADWSGRETLDIAQLDRTIHTVTKMLIEDARDKETHLPEVFAYHKERLRNIGAELEEIACQLDPKRDRQPVNAKTLEQFSKAGEKTIEARALNVYLSRVAYFAMTRILLVRVWEDVKLIDQSLYDGGFDKWYEVFNQEIQKVLDYAFDRAAKHYPWLYHSENNYKWFNPSGKVIVDVLYEFCEFNLGRLNTDILGTVYEKYVEDRFEKKQKGLFYTPREIIKFIWDRAGFTNDEAFFRIECDSREPRYIFDPATGSGGFLVEAARRIIEESHYNHSDLESLFSIHYCVTEGLQGSELNVFAHYITEVNLLIQFTPLLKDMMRQREYLKLMPSLKLSTVAADSMSLLIDPIGRKTKLNEREEEANGFIDLTKETRADPNKVETYNEIRGRQDFDYCCANPPYLGEDEHKELFRYTREHFPVWNTHYKGKMDLFYWFIILGLAKLREGGKLCFITTHYWPTADGASKLRGFILDNALILEMIDFGEVTIFDNAPGQHDMVFVLERLKGRMRLPENSEPNGATKRKLNNRIKIVRVKKDIPKPNGNELSRLGRLTAHIQENIERDSYEDEFIEVYWAAYLQGELSEKPWSLFVREHERHVLDRLEASGSKLVDCFSVEQGVVPNPLEVSKKVLKHIPASIIEEHSIRVGKGVFVLKNGEVSNLKLEACESQYVVPFFKNSSVDPYVVTEKTDRCLLYMTDDLDIDKLPHIRDYLELFKGYLIERRECKSGRRKWFSLHWPRKRDLFEKPKLVAGYREERAQFAFTDKPFFASTDMYYIVPRRDQGIDLYFLLGLLNSSLTDFWLHKKGKPKGSIQEQFATPLEKIPLPSLEFSNKNHVSNHKKMVELVKDMIETKKELAQYSPYYEGFRLTRLEGQEDLKERKPSPLLVSKALPQKSRRALHLHSSLGVVGKPPDPFILTSPGEIRKEIVEGYILPLRGKGKMQVIIKGEKELLKYLKEVLSDMKGSTWKEIKALPVPVDIAVLNERIKEVEKEAKRLLRKASSIQKKIDELVYKLYDLTEDEIKIVEGREVNPCN
ncbi:N-6 DNA methylase [candidate division WOR-3 bacterium]|nr:N-6 DNA methylase [candidate division WOR-3 bacterium]